MIGRLLNVIFAIATLFFVLLLSTYKDSAERWMDLFLITLGILILVPCLNYIIFKKFRLWNNNIPSR
jgi:hypothetical protein